ncbi:MFS transporter [Spiribacter halobius]|uniref:MFS transporter n=1 Tax=Sediminicurvatus halobius TaxID=2182432 RepID=A0A2U2MYS5_9GAMM|nr:MFS transporter [Spiribacter halobius]PWG61879.1 MFS transporter [Spiribacter halobius]UEX79247.1 MFS transporter [Spiribacter halobius]
MPASEPPEQPPPDPRAERVRNLLWVSLGLCATFVVQTMMLVATPLYAVRLGAGPTLTGAILAMPYVLPLVLAIPMGSAVTRFGARRVLMLGGLALAASPAAVLLAPGYGGLVAAQLLLGLGHTLMVLSAQAIVSGLGRGRALERAFGWYSMFVSVGQLVGPLLAGWLIDLDGLERAFQAMVVLSLLSLASGGFLVGSAQRAAPASAAETGYIAQLRLLGDNRGVQLSLAISVAVIFALAALASFLPVYLETLALSATAIGALLSLRALCAMLVRPIMATLIDLAGGRRRAIPLSVLAVAVGLMLTGTTGNVWLLGLLAILLGIGSGLSQPLSMVVLAEHAPSAQRAGALGMRLTANRAMQFLAPLLVGVIAGTAGFGAAFFAAGALVGLCLLPIHRLIDAPGTPPTARGCR